ncbi:hypothetical protein [Nocardioides sp. CFH 31398]|uniref:hypothetical protein n=1 Tax=Nocardioides sp. CFH 31398 TaxID=2919579 RepID=UPI001F05E448|nr:hypothetical protein [Nocardioides sp. CFH 31398]MCH1867469.1 hypothetical protein [Nocardioides sp. CFH 31398]
MRHAARRRTGPPVVALLAVLASAVLVAAAVVVTGVVSSSTSEAVPRYASADAPVASPEDPLDVPRGPDGLDMLRAFDEARSRAWAEGDPAALERLYAPGSAAGAADVAMLTRYAERGLRVEGLRTQVLSAEVRRATPVRRVLAVTDRVVGGAVTDGQTSEALPVDAATTHRMTWRLVDGDWLLTSVR